YDFQVIGCDLTSQCLRTWWYYCDYRVDNYPTPKTAEHPWCPCVQQAPVSCDPSNLVVGGTGHTCALVNGGIQCWGGNNRGQLGNGMKIDSIQRVQVSGLSSGVVSASAGGVHTCAVKQGGAAQCWGGNEHGQLGNGQPGNDGGTPDDRTAP